MAIYFIHATTTNRVKIGYSENPQERLRQLQTGSPFTLQLLRTFEGNRTDEAMYHQKFRHLRIDESSEWFLFDAELRELINALEMVSTESVDGMPVLRGVITGLTDRWFGNSDGLTESPDAYLHVYCPQCERPHRHGWSLADGLTAISHRAAHCDNGGSYKDRGYYIGLVQRPGVHAHSPGKLLQRPTKR